jgi:hypothetical protein
MTRYKGNFLFDEKEFNIFKLRIFVEKLSNFLSLFFQSSLVFFRIRNDLFPDPYPDPDPAKSFGSDRIRIHNTILTTVPDVEEKCL